MFRLARGTAFVLGLGLLFAFAAKAQVLARPGWAGSGVAPEPWWLRAVIYRIDPARFQDSDGDGQGDVEGIVQRLDYLQSLGVDALLLDGPDALDGPVSDRDLGDLIREASRHHLRVLMTVPAALEVGPRDAVLGSARTWLSAGIAGFWLPKPEGNMMGAPSYTSLVSVLEYLVRSFPGERVLITESAPSSTGVAPTFGRHGTDTVATARGGVLVGTSPLPVGSGSAETLGDALAAASQQPGLGLNPLQRFAVFAAAGSGHAIADAALLFGGRGAVMLNFGQEIGLNTFPSPTPGKASAALPVMQWTPSNRTPATVAEANGIGSAPAGSPSGQFGAYHPYVRPPRELTGPPASSVRVVADPNLPATAPEPDALPGFTSAPLPAPIAVNPRKNVVTEDRDPGSLLHAYRQLIALHHANASLRHGELRVLASNVPGTLVWVRRAPAGTRTVANVIGAVNLSGVAVTLSIRGALEGLGLRSGPLRLLFASSAREVAGETIDHFTLPSNAALLCELSASRRPSAKMAASRHRVGR